MSKIEWTEKTWNPIHGCTKVSEACQNCYAEVMARRLQGNHIKSYENGFKVSRNIDAMKEPYQWQKPTMVFVCSMGDLFHEDVPDTWINPVMRVIEKTPQHTYQILTKRPWRMDEYFLAIRCRRTCGSVRRARAADTMTASTLCATSGATT